MKKKIHVVAAIVCSALVPAIAFADWQWKWGMSLDDVAKAAGVSAASAVPVEDSTQLKAPYTSGGRRYDGTFTFEQAKLAGVSLAAVDPTDCLAIEQSLEKEYKKPDTQKETPGVMAITTWHSAKDQVVWMRVGDRSASKSCLATYTPRH